MSDQDQDEEYNYRIENRLKSEFDIGPDDYESIKKYLEKGRMDSMEDEKVKNILKKIQNTQKIISNVSSEMVNLGAALHGDKRKMNQADETLERPNVLNKKLERQSTTDFNQAMFKGKSENRKQIRLKTIGNFLRALVTPQEYLDDVNGRRKESQAGMDATGKRPENHAIMADLVIIHAITTNCAKFFHETNLNDAADFYRTYSEKSASIFNQHLEEQDAVFGDGGFENTEVERLLTEPNPFLETETVIKILYEVDLENLLPSEEVTNTLQHVFYGYVYTKIDLSVYSWRFWLNMLTFGMFAPLILNRKTSADLKCFTGLATRFFSDAFSLNLCKATRVQYGDAKPYEECSWGQKWWCFMTTPLVKLLYKTVNELVVLVILICYSLLGQTYKSKNFDWAFYGAIVFMLFNNMRLVFFFFYTDKAVIAGRGDEAKMVRSTWACMKWKRSWQQSLIALIQYISLIANVISRQTFIQSTPTYAIVPTLTYEHSKTTDAEYKFATSDAVQFWNVTENKASFWRSSEGSDAKWALYFEYAEGLYGKYGYDATIQRAPRLFNIPSYMLYFIFYPTVVEDPYKTPLTEAEWKAKECMGERQDEFGYDECCWTGTKLAEATGDDRTGGDVAAWLEKTALDNNPVCFFPTIAAIGYGNMVLTNITMLVATVLFLRNFRLTRLGAMINSIVACLKEFFWWCLVALCFVIPFAVLQFNLFFPNSMVKSVDDGYDCSGDKCEKLESGGLYNEPNILKNMFKMTTFNVFGEMFFDFFDAEEHKPWTCDPVTMREAGGLCQDYNPWSVAFLALYMLMMALVLVNILIAIFSEAWVATVENRPKVSSENLLHVIIEESYSLPFATGNFLFQGFCFVWCIISLPIAIIIWSVKECRHKQCCTEKSGTSFFQHVRGYIQVTLFPRMFPFKNPKPANDLKKGLDHTGRSLSDEHLRMLKVCGLPKTISINGAAPEIELKPMSTRSSIRMNKISPEDVESGIEDQADHSTEMTVTNNASRASSIASL